MTRRSRRRRCPAGESLPPGSLVVNATGMGKDRPGSPLGPTSVFPRDGVVWEFNYRGSLDFWHQALAQRSRAAAARRRRLALLRARLDPGRGRGVRRGDAAGHRRRARRDRRPAPLMTAPSRWSAPCSARSPLADARAHRTTTSTCSRSVRCCPATSSTTSRPAGPRRRRCAGSGFATMVDATPIGLGRRPEAVARISASHRAAGRGDHRCPPRAALRRRSLAARA